jgi:hypothetical protein
MNLDHLEAALEHARRAWRVIALHSIRDGRCTCERAACDSPGKHPLLAGWQTQATTGEQTIREWWQKWSDANVGIVTGNGLLVLDVDPRHGGDETLAELETRYGPLPETLRTLTGGGGVHLFLTSDGPLPNRADFLPGLDVRGDGGFVVAPPSLHVTGRRYAWEIGAGPDDMPLAAAPDWLIDRVRSRRTNGMARPPDEWATLVRGPIMVGSRNDSLARLTGYLLRRRPAPHVVLELVRAVNRARCTPPLSDEEVVRTVDSIARREAERMRHVDARS